MKSLITAFALVLSLSVGAQTPQPPEIAARSYILMDVTSGQVLTEKDADASVEPASLTKVMSAYLVFDALRSKKITLTQTLPVSVRAWKMEGSRMFIDPKMQVPVDDLIKGMIVQSGNDATVALAEGVAGSVEQFVKLMNDEAKSMGLKSTGYRNVAGLTEPGHATTARDMAILSSRLIQDFPEYLGYYSIKKYHYAGTPASNENNRNLLLYRDPSVDGLKTGYTEAAGYCMVVTAKRDFPNLVQAGAPAGSAAATGRRRLLSVVLGTASANARANESQKLINWGYTAFEAVKLFDANQAVVSPPVWKGTAPTLKLGRTEPVIVTVPAGSKADIKTEVARPDPLVAPFTKGQKVATLKISAGNQLVAELPLMALEDVGQAGILGRAWDSIRLWIK
ncbi:MAG: D-alanyl-D-alanine carboxypeptidase family protein [Burkholderiaceae bacterium]